jgi:FdhD protein
MNGDSLSFIFHLSTMAATTIVHVTKAGHTDPRPDLVPTEEPLEIRVGERALAVTMRTPGDDFDLAAGFLFTEGVIKSGGEIESIREWGSPNVVRVALREGVSVDWQRLQRHFYATSSCGVCGKTSIDALRVATTPVDDDVRVSAALLATLPDALRRAQRTFEATGSIHAAGAFTRDGALLCAREDVGRHNAVDKVIGAMLREGRRAEVMVLSGRAGFEVVQKCVVARIPVVAAVGGPTSLAVALAREFRITLAGFVRDGHFNLYSGR